MCIAISFFVLLLHFVNGYNTFKLITPPQWRLLQYYIKNPETTQSMKTKIQYILYQRHTPLKMSIYNNFIAHHKYKCKLVHKDDLYQHACIGLLRATEKYNGNSAFYLYASTYVRGELYNGLTIHYPIDKKSKKERRQKPKPKPYNYETVGEQNEYRANSYLGKNDYIAAMQNADSKMCLYRDVWNKIDDFTPFIKCIMHYKFDYDFTIIRSNLEISKMFNCSEETIRKNVHMVITNITAHNIYNEYKICN